MTLTMLDTITSIPALIKEKFEMKESIKRTARSITQTKVKVIASGSSYNTASIVKSFADKFLNISVDVIYPNYFTTNFTKNQYEEDTLYLFISQSGKTKSIIDAIKIINKMGGTTLSITEKLNSPIGKLSHINLEIGSKNEPFIYRTSGVSLTLLTLYLFFIYLAENLATITPNKSLKYIADLERYPEKISDVVKLAFEEYDKYKSPLSNSEAIFFAGGSELWAVAQEADIKFMEMIPIISNSFEIEEIIHGPQNCFTSKISFFFLSNNKADFEKALKIDSFVRKEVGSFSKVLAPYNYENVTKIGDKTAVFDSLLYLSFFQVLSYLFSQDQNRDLSKRIYPSIDMYINKTV
ncbi:SIS domain-containing protein [Enterococcus sp. DIV0086]|uniref:SIS domain-containing protein n=1 Tax=Enterococcus sp. DIV0086 TaxID=2774655 RepID=UPI003D2740EA